MVRTLLLGIASAAFCVGFQVAAMAQETAVQRAFQMRMEGKLDEAKQLLEAETSKAPKETAAWIELARLEFQRAGVTKELDSAQKAIDKAIESNPESARAHHWASHIAAYHAVLKSGDRAILIAQIKKGIEESETAVRLDPNDHGGRRLLVALYGNNPRDLGGDPDKAEAHVKALEARSLVDGAIARCELSHKSAPEKRLAIWNELSKSHGEDPRVAEQLALHFARAGDAEKAEAPLRKALSLAPKQGKILLETARALALSGKPDPAAKLLKEYVAFAPPGPLAHRSWAHMALGRVMLMKGEKAAAEDWVRKAKALDPYCWFTMTPPPMELFEAP